MKKPNCHWSAKAAKWSATRRHGCKRGIIRFGGDFRPCHSTWRHCTSTTDDKSHQRKIVKNGSKSPLLIMSQQSVLTSFFAVATPEQIAQNNEREWAALRNDRKAQQAFKRVFSAMRDEKSAEDRRKNNAKRAREYRARHRVTKGQARKQVSRFCVPL